MRASASVSSLLPLVATAQNRSLRNKHIELEQLTVGINVRVLMLTPRNGRTDGLVAGGWWLPRENKGARTSTLARGTLSANLQCEKTWVRSKQRAAKPRGGRTPSPRCQSIVWPVPPITETSVKGTDLSTTSMLAPLHPSTSRG